MRGLFFTVAVAVGFDVLGDYGGAVIVTVVYFVDGFACRLVGADFFDEADVEAFFEPAAVFSDGDEDFTVYRDGVGFCGDAFCHLNPSLDD